VKLRTLLDLRGNIPTFIRISKGTLHDGNVLDALVPEPGSCYVMGRGCLDDERFYRPSLARAFFVIRAKSNLRFRGLHPRAVNKSTGLRCDQSIVLTGFYSAQRKQHLRIKAFLGTSENAVKFQIWIAVSATCWWQSSRSSTPTPLSTQSYRFRG
jgi:hypothetical protein